MTLVYTRYGPWYGFRYTDAEKQEMAELDKSVPSAEYYTWLVLTAVVAIAAFAVVVTLGTMGLLAVIGGEEHMKDTPATLFFFTLYFEVLFCLCCVLPVVMVLCSGVTGRWFKVALNLLPDRTTTGRLFRKVWFQIVRMTVILSGIALLYWLFVPVGSKLDLLVRFIVPMLAPLVTTLTTGWLVAGRLGR
jgi:hypothetical protein